MILIYTLYLLLSSLIVYFIFYSSLNNMIKASALTAIVLLGFVTQDHYERQLGKPLTVLPDGEFVYVHHLAAGSEITLWAWTEAEGHRLYTFDYDQETAEKLEEAKTDEGEGKKQAGTFEERVTEQNPGIRFDDCKGPTRETNK